jgi:hypothetical protein
MERIFDAKMKEINKKGNRSRRYSYGGKSTVSASKGI